MAVVNDKNRRTGQGRSARNKNSGSSSGKSTSASSSSSGNKSASSSGSNKSGTSSTPKSSASSYLGNISPKPSSKGAAASYLGGNVTQSTSKPNSNPFRTPSAPKSGATSGRRASSHLGGNDSSAKKEERASLYGGGEAPKATEKKKEESKKDTQTGGGRPNPRAQKDSQTQKAPMSDAERRYHDADRERDIYITESLLKDNQAMDSAEPVGDTEYETLGEQMRAISKYDPDEFPDSETYRELRKQVWLNAYQYFSPENSGIATDPDTFLKLIKGELDRETADQNTKVLLSYWEGQLELDHLVPVAEEKNFYEEGLTDEDRNANLENRNKRYVEAEKNYQATQDELDALLQSEEYRNRRQDLWQNTAFEILGKSFTDIFKKDDLEEKEDSLRDMLAYWDDQRRRIKEESIADTDLKEIQAMSEEDKVAFAHYANILDLDALSELTSPEQATQLRRDVVTYSSDMDNKYDTSALESKYGKKRLDELAESYRRIVNARNADTTRTDAAEFAKEHPILGSIASVGASAAGAPVGAMSWIMDFANRVMGNDSRYQTLDPNSAGNRLNLYADTIRGNVAQDIQEQNEGIGGSLGSWAYQAAMTLGDIGAGALVGGPAVGAALSAGRSFSSAMQDATQRGVDPGNAFLYATAVAGIEYATEKIPLDDLWKAAKSGKKPVSALLKNTFRQGAIEASTEELSMIGTMFADAAINQDKRERAQTIAEMVVNGASYEEAEAQANKMFIQEAIDTAMVSALAGGLSGASATVAGGIKGVDTQGVDTQEKKPTDKPQYSPEVQVLLDELNAEQTQAAPQEAAPVETAPTAPVIAEQAAADIAAASAQQEADVAQQAAPPAATPKPVTQDIIEMAGRDLAEAKPTTNPAPTYTAEDIQRATDSVFGVDSKQEKGDNLQDMNKTGTPEVPDAYAQSRDVRNVLPSVPDVSIDNSDEDVNGSDKNNAETSVGAASANFAGTRDYDLLLSDENAQRDRKGDVRPVEVPKKDADGRIVSDFVGNAYGSENVPDDFIPTIRKLVTEGKLSHDVQTNQETFGMALDGINQDGIVKTMNELRAVVDNKRTGSVDEAKAMILLDYFNSKDGRDNAENAATVFTYLTAMTSEGGRSTQLANAFRKMTPQGMISVIEGNANRMIADLQRSGKVKKDYQASVDPQLLDAYKTFAKKMKAAESEADKQKYQKAMDEVEQNIYMMEAAKLPVTQAEKWKAWRYMSMLGNVKTQVRNLGGNAISAGYTEAKRTMNTVLERIIIRDKSKRRSAVLFESNKGDKALLDWAEADANSDLIHEKLKESALIGDDTKSNIMKDNLRIFKSDFFEKVRTLINAMTEGGDLLFKNREYKRSLAGYLKAQGYTAADIQAGKVSEDVLNNGRAFAIQEALKATFNDANKVSDTLSSMRFKEADTWVKRGINAMGEGVLPFRRTPANILVRSIEYSPAGIVKGVWQMADSIRTGKTSAATAIDSLSAGLVGTSAMLLGAALAKGIGGVKLTGSDVDDDEKRQGHQEYAIEFSMNGETYSYKIDWAAPGNLPLFVGANLYDMLTGQGEDGEVDGLDVLTSLIYSGQNMLEPMLSLSCLSSLNDLFESAKYAEEGEAIWSVAANVATSYFTQGIPSILRQTDQVIHQGNGKQTFVDTENPLAEGAGKFVAGIPFVGNLLKTDYVDAWGEKQDNGGALKRIVNSYLNPMSIKKVDNSKVEQEITRLNDSIPGSVTPPYIGQNIEYTDLEGQTQSRHLTEEEYNTLREVQGQTASDILNHAMDLVAYDGLTDTMKGEVFDRVYEYAKEKGLAAAIGDRYSAPDAWIRDMGKDPAETIITKVIGDTMKKAIESTVEDIQNGFTKNEDANSRGIQEAYDSFKNAPKDMQRDVLEKANGKTEKYITAREGGVSHEDMAAVFKNTANIDGNDDYAIYDAIADSVAGEDTQVTIMKAYMPDFDPNALRRDYTELKLDDVTDMGFAPRDFSDIRNAVASQGKWRDAAALLRQMYPDLSQSDAYELTTIFKQYSSSNHYKKRNLS